MDECDTRDNSTDEDNADEGSEVCTDSLDKQQLVISARRKVGNCGDDGDNIPTVMKAFLRSARILCLFYIFNVITKICSTLLSRIFIMAAEGLQSGTRSDYDWASGIYTSCLCSGCALYIMRTGSCCTARL